MARPAPASYSPLSGQQLGSDVPIGETAETTLIENVHYAWMTVCPTLICTIYTSDASATAGVQPYVIGANPASPAIHGLWNLDFLPEPFLAQGFDITVLFENTGPATPADDGVIRFDWESDPWVAGAPPTGTYVDLTARGGSAQWTVASGYLAYPAGTADTLRVWALNGASGEIRVHAVDVRPRALSSVAAGPVQVGSDWWYPLDDTETDQDSPLSTAHRQAQWDGCEIIRRSRPGHPIGWSENPQIRAGAEPYVETAAAYVRQITLPVWVPRGVTELRWSLYGYRAAAATSGYVEITTLTRSDVDDDAAVECALPATWVSPYNANVFRYDDGGSSSLAVTPESWDEIRVGLKGDGSNPAYLMGLCCWFAPAGS